MREHKARLHIDGDALNIEESLLQEQTRKMQRVRLFLAGDDRTKLSGKEIDCCIRATD